MHTSIEPWRLFPGLLLLGLLPSISDATTTHCVTTGAQLVNALATAESNGDHDVIRIARGSYTAPASGFAYFPAAPENFNLTISGGWLAGIDTPCDFQGNARAYHTILEGGSGRVMSINGNSSVGETISISLLSFSGGFSVGDPGAGLSIDLGTTGGDIYVDRSAFFENDGAVGAALAIVGTQLIQLRSSVIFANTSSFASVYVYADGDPGAYLLNNTIVDNLATGSGGSVVLQSKLPASVLAANNILWGSEGFDLNVSGTGNHYVHNNDIGIGPPSPGLLTEYSNNISVEPAFMGSAIDFVPAASSAMRDAGRLPPLFVPMPIPFDDDWHPGSMDFPGRPRIAGSSVDIGAAEYPELFGNGFE